jgi:hypothetical protein
LLCHILRQSNLGQLDALNPALFDGVEGGLGTGLYVQLGEYVSQVNLYRVDTDKELPGDLLVARPGGYQSENL